MSSFVRRLEIKILKRKGYVRQLWKIINDMPVRVKHGVIINPKGESTGSTQWPRP